MTDRRLRLILAYATLNETRRRLRLHAIRQLDNA